MAAALLQYQACLGIMVRLQVEDLSLLKQDFDRTGRGLSLCEFVSVMLDRVSWEPESVVGFIEDLVELFAQVDVNGDGSMEWEEFTSAIIEGGMGSSSSGGDNAIGSAAELRDLQYEEHPRFTDTAVNRPPKRLEYLPEFRRLLLLESSRPVVELLDPAGLFPPEMDEDSKEGGIGSVGGGNGKGIPAELSSGGDDGASSASSFSFTPTLPVLNKFHPLCYISGYRRDQDDVRSERSPVQALKYLAGVDLLAVSAGDLKLTFWSTSLLTACSTSALETPRPLAIVHTPRPQRVLEWSATTRQLFSISADLIISVWLVTRDRSSSTGGGTSARATSGKTPKNDGTCDVRLVATLKKHTDLLQDLLVLNSDTLLSCAMDGLIYFWDTHSLLPRASRQGHRRGVRLLQKLSAQVFLSAGFECEVFGWEISALATSPVFRLSGHGAPVCCIQLIPSAVFASAAQTKSSSTSGASSADSTRLLADQVITVDDDGWFRWWSLANVLSMESTDAELSSSRRCLQAFRLGSDANRYPWRVHSLAVLNHGQSLLVAGVHKLKLLRRVRVKPRVLAASAVLYNGASLTLATATDREVRVWDAASGALLRSYRELVGADITCVDLDARQRKIVVGAQNGELAVVNYLNGAVLARWTPHAQQVSALLYCKEDRCVLTASWDRSLRLYDDDAPRTGGGGARSALLRCITDAHESDIKCLAYCHALSLVASGGTDGVIKIWDYIYFLLEDTCVAPMTGVSSLGAFSASPTAHSQAQSDVNVLEFVEPYPLLLSGHESGQVCVWSLTPSKPTSLLLCFYPFRMTPPPIMPRLSLAVTTPEEKPANVAGERTTEDTVETTANDAEQMLSVSTEANMMLKSPRESGIVSLEDTEAESESKDTNAEPNSQVEDSAEATTAPSALPPPPPSSPLTPAKLNSAVTCCRAFYDETGGEQLAAGIDRGRFLLFTTSFYGELSVCDVSQVIAGAHVRAFREENMPSRQDRAYNPRRRFLRQGKNAKRLRNKHAVHTPSKGNVPLQVKETDVVCVNRWTAHRGNVRCLQVVDEPRGILTCGSDKGVKVWDFEGRCLGSLATGAALQPPPVPKKGSVDVTEEGEENSGRDGSVWAWEVDVAHAAILKRTQAETLWDELKTCKMKVGSARQQPGVPVTQEQQNNPTLHSSKSVPMLRRSSRGSLRCLLEDTLAVSSSTDSLETPEPGMHTPAEARRERASVTSIASTSCSNHAQRLFQQLQGKTTWKQSDLQLARQAAWEKERVKFQQRMKKIMKRKSKKQLQEQQHQVTTGVNSGNQRDGDSGEVNSSAPDGGVSDSLGSLSAAGSVGDAVSSSLQLPTLQHPVTELPFADKDNWEVGSLNRERQMYVHFHRENVRRSNKQIAGSSGLLRQRRLENSLATMDLTPSPFLLEKLGVSCIIRENQDENSFLPRRRTGKKPRPKRVNALQRTASTPALPPRPEVIQQDANQSEATLTSSASTGALPKRTLIETLCQQYDELLGDDDDEPESTQKHVDHTARLLTRAVSFAPRNRGDLKPAEASNDGQQHDDATAETDKPTASRGNSYKVRRRGLGAPRLGGTSAKTRKEMATSSSSHVEKENSSTKKVRIRSDAALMRQERFGPYAREDVLNVYRTFRKLDQDQSGSITLRELFGGAGLFSGTHLQDNIGSIFSSIDQDQSGQIDLVELCSVVFGDAPATVLEEILRLCRLLETVEKNRRVRKKTLSPEQVQELRELFRLYDADDNGDIDASELFEALRYNERFYENDRRESVQLTKSDVERIISRFDVDANATLDLNEFIELFREDA